MINNFKKLKFYIKFKNLHKSKKTILIIILYKLLIKFIIYLILFEKN